MSIRIIKQQRLISWSIGHTLTLALCIVVSACGSDSGDRSNPVSEAEYFVPNKSQISQINQGVGLMGSFDYPGALEVFEPLATENPSWDQAVINYAIALKNRQAEGDAEQALNVLGVLLERSPNSAQANFVAGVLNLYLGQVEQAESYFAKALSLDPSDAYTNYYLGQCKLRAGKPQEALNLYNKAIELDPYLRSSYYSAAQVQRRLGNKEESKSLLDTFKRFDNNPQAKLAEFKYTRMGPKSLVQVVQSKEFDGSEVERASLPQGPLFREPSSLVKVDSGAISLSSTDINNDGLPDLTVLYESNILTKINSSDGVYLDRDMPWSGVAGAQAIAWGDIDNNGLLDLYICRHGENQLWTQSEEGFTKVDESKGVSDGARQCTDTTLVDADHDGDLDILIANIDGASLLSNNRDGTFRSLNDRLLGAATLDGITQLLTTDIDNDNDVDLVFISDQQANLALLNDRLWQYRKLAGFEVVESEELASLASADLDADGQVELVGATKGGGINLYKLSDNRVWDQRVIIDPSSEEAGKGIDIALLDFTGDGKFELLISIDGQFSVFSTGADVTQLHSSSYAGLAARPAVLSNSGYSVMAVTQDGEERTVTEWAPGEGRFSFLNLRLTGKHDAAETMRSNHSGIGSTVSVRDGSNWSVIDSHKNSSFKGYDVQPIVIGLRGAETADFVAIDWSDGVYQTELNVQSGDPVLIAEEQRQLGSCPVLFAWRGNKFDFVTDILGVGAQGFLVEPGTLLPPRPWEFVAFPPNTIDLKDGRYQFKVTEPMEENSFIDRLSMHLYDLPKDWKMVMDERMGTGAPEVTGEPLFYREELFPVVATDARGKNVLTAIAEADQVAMNPGEIDRRYIGLLKQEQSVALRFEQAIDKHPSKDDAIPVLVADSWVELPYSQTHFAAWQAGKAFKSVTLEARVPGQKDWQLIYPDFGIPAGMPRVMSLPMSDLPEGTTELRISWNREIYWDRIKLVWAEPAPTEMVTTSITPTTAVVAKSGFSTRVNHSQRRPEYIYQQRKTFGDVKYPTGFYTQLGEMTELVSKRDDAVAIIGPGEEVHVEFKPQGAPERGLNRWVVLETRGWAKDKDLYTHLGGTVEPLPRSLPDTNIGAREQLHDKYNTRFQSGR